MRTHIFIALVAMLVTACASKEHVSQAEIERQQREEFTFRENPSASRIR